MQRTLFFGLAVLFVVGCQLPSSSKVLYRCQPDASCAQTGFTCWSDGYCHPAADGLEDAGGGGGSAGGTGGGTGGGLAGGAGGGGGAAGGVGGGGGSSGGTGGGTDAGGGAGGGATDAGDDAGADAGDDGGTDAGVDAGCTPATSCGATVCGFMDAGCGLELECAPCLAPEECGVGTPNACGLPKLCTRDFCWENPLPQGNGLRAAFALGPRAVWAVGDLGTVVFWNGERTQLVDVGTTANLRDVHGSGAGDLYVVGEGGLVLHFDGVTWSRETTQGTYRINTVWAAGGGLAFAGANGGYILKRDSGTRSWSEMSFTGVSSTADIMGLVGVQTGEVYATSFARVFRLPNRTASSWVADTDWTGTNRDTIALGATPTQLFAGGKITGQPYGVLLARQADGGWAQFGPRTPVGFERIGAWQDDQPWVAGEGGQVNVLSSDGGVVTYAASRAVSVPALAVTGPGSAFFAGASGTMALVADGGVRELFFGSTVNLNAICGFADARMYGPADQRLVYERRSNAAGVRWDTVYRDAGNVNRWLTCFAQGADKVWVTGDDRYFLKQSGGVFQTQDLTQNSNWVAVWGSDGGPWYFVSTSQGVYSSPTGDNPTYIAGVNSPAAMYGVSDTDFYIVGANSDLRTHNPGYWTDDFAPVTGRNLRAIHAIRQADGGPLYSVVGDNTAWRRVGGSWTVDTIPNGNSLRATWIMPSQEIWAAGDDGGSSSVLWRYVADGGWTPQPLPSTKPFTGMTGLGDVGPFVVGQGGVILRHAGADGG